MKKSHVNQLAALLFMVLTVSILHGQNYEMEKQVLSSGGQASGGQFELSAGAGQITVEKSMGGQFTVQAGFWQVNNDLIFKDEFE